MKKCLVSINGKKLFHFDTEIEGDELRAADHKKRYDEKIGKHRAAVRQVACDLHANDPDKVVTLAQTGVPPDEAVRQVRRENPLMFDVSTLERGDIDFTKISPEEYMVIRKENPSAIGMD